MTTEVKIDDNKAWDIKILVLPRGTTTRHDPQEKATIYTIPDDTKLSLLKGTDRYDFKDISSSGTVIVYGKGREYPMHIRLGMRDKNRTVLGKILRDGNNRRFGIARYVGR